MPALILVYSPFLKHQLSKHQLCHMAKKTVTSHDQKGGITAFEVNVNRASSQSEVRRSAPLPRWLQWFVALAAIVGAIAAVIALI